MSCQLPSWSEPTAACLHSVSTKNGAKVLTKIHFPSDSLSFILWTMKIIVAGVTSLTKANSGTRSYSRYVCSPCLLTAAKDHICRGSSAGLILYRINLGSSAKTFSTCQLSQPCHVCPQTFPSWCQCSVSLCMQNSAFLISLTLWCTFHKCLCALVKEEQLKWKNVRNIHLENNITMIQCNLCPLPKDPLIIPVSLALVFEREHSV